MFIIFFYLAPGYEIRVQWVCCESLRQLKVSRLEGELPSPRNHFGTHYSHVSKHVPWMHTLLHSRGFSAASLIDKRICRRGATKANAPFAFAAISFAPTQNHQKNCKVLVRGLCLSFAFIFLDTILYPTFPLPSCWSVFQLLQI